MGKDPAVLFYTSDFLTGIRFFTMEQRGQYITLLCEQHQLGHIPENHMISVCESNDSPVIKKFKKDDEGLYYNERMEKEKIKRENYCKSRSNNKSGRKKKKSYDFTYDKSHDKHMSQHMENENENRNKDVIKDRNIIPPTLEMIKNYIKLKGYNVDAEKWYNFYQAKNWMIGKNKMKDWQAAVRTWLPDKKSGDNKIKEEYGF
jgi:hypothetical protein